MEMSNRRLMANTTRLLLLLVMFLHKVCIGGIVKSNYQYHRDYVTVGEVAHENDDHEVKFAVQPRNMEELTKILHQVSDPNHELYGRYLSRKQLAELTGNNDGIAAITAFLVNNGVSNIKVSPFGEFITARSSIRVWNEIFQTRFHQFKQVVGQRKLFGKSTKGDGKVKTKLLNRAFEFVLPDELESHIQAVFHVADFAPPYVPKSIVKQLAKDKLQDRTKINEENTHSTSHMRTLASVLTPALINSFYGVKSNAGSELASQLVYASFDQNYSPDDLVTFQTQYGLPYDTVAVTVNDHNSSAVCTNSSGSCIEANLDVQYLMGIANGVPTTYYYEVSTGSNFLVDWVDYLLGLDDPPLVNSISYGAEENQYTISLVSTFDAAMIKLAVLGVTVLAGSGDDGVAGHYARSSSSYCGYNPLFPATSPYVLSIGATQGPESNDPEIACTSATGGTITTGGGFSNLYGRPSWQEDAVTSYFATLKANNYTAASGYNTTGRGIPDLSLMGYNYAVIIGGATYGISGTSAATPAFAAMISLINSARLDAGRPALGWIVPTIYANYSIFVNDIMSGENNCAADEGDGSIVCCSQGFNATEGWDPVTGFGSVRYSSMYALLFSLGYQYTNPPTSTPSSVPTSEPSAPTPMPSRKPTRSPTIFPFKAPTFKPSFAPTPNATQTVAPEKSGGSTWVSGVSNTTFIGIIIGLIAVCIILYSIRLCCCSKKEDEYDEGSPKSSDNLFKSDNRSWWWDALCSCCFNNSRKHHRLDNDDGHHHHGHRHHHHHHRRHGHGLGHHNRSSDSLGEDSEYNEIHAQSKGGSNKITSLMMNSLGRKNNKNKNDRSNNSNNNLKNASNYSLPVDDEELMLAQIESAEMQSAREQEFENYDDFFVYDDDERIRSRDTEGSEEDDLEAALFSAECNEYDEPKKGFYDDLYNNRVNNNDDLETIMFSADANEYGESIPDALSIVAQNGFHAKGKIDYAEELALAREAKIARKLAKNYSKIKPSLQINVEDSSFGMMAQKDSEFGFPFVASGSGENDLSSPHGGPTVILSPRYEGDEEDEDSADDDGDQQHGELDGRNRNNDSMFLSAEDLAAFGADSVEYKSPAAMNVLSIFDAMDEAKSNIYKQSLKANDPMEPTVLPVHHLTEGPGIFTIESTDYGDEDALHYDEAGFATGDVFDVSASPMISRSPRVIPSVTGGGYSNNNLRSPRLNPYSSEMNVFSFDDIYSYSPRLGENAGSASSFTLDRHFLDKPTVLPATGSPSSFHPSIIKVDDDDKDEEETPYDYYAADDADYGSQGPTVTNFTPNPLPDAPALSPRKEKPYFFVDSSLDPTLDFIRPDSPRLYSLHDAAIPMPQFFSSVPHLSPGQNQSPDGGSDEIQPESPRVAPAPELISVPEVVVEQPEVDANPDAIVDDAEDVEDAEDAGVFTLED